MSTYRFKKLYTKDFLIKEYVNNKKSAYIIAKENNSDISTVNYWLSRHKIGKRYYVSRLKNMCGKKFGKLKVLERNKDNNKYGAALWTCLCDCGHIENCTSSSLILGKLKCSLCWKKEMVERMFEGYMDISKDYFSRLADSAKKRKLEFSISIEYLWNLFVKQNKKCALTGKELVLIKTKKNKNKQTASIDRIDSSKGYVEGNLQWIDKWVNLMKSDFSQDEFIFICQQVVDYKGNKNVEPTNILCQQKSLHSS